jgi:hypothetical protein
VLPVSGRGCIAPQISLYNLDLPPRFRWHSPLVPPLEWTLCCYIWCPGRLATVELVLRNKTIKSPYGANRVVVLDRALTTPRSQSYLVSVVYSASLLLGFTFFQLLFFTASLLLRLTFAQIHFCHYLWQEELFAEFSEITSQQSSFFRMCGCLKEWRMTDRFRQLESKN